MEHTPGPWEVKETSDGMTNRPNRKRLEIVSPCPEGGEMVIDCLKDANAAFIVRFIVRACNADEDMLAALQGLFEQCAMVHKHWGESSNQKEADAAISAARAAIVKAKEGDA